MAGNAGKGRVKGSHNKSTALFKQALERAYDHLGGQERFNAWAFENQDVFYAQLMPKLLPIQLNHADNEGGKLVPILNVHDAISHAQSGPSPQAEDGVPQPIH